MIILIDSGSSVLHLGWWDGGQVVKTINVPYPAATADLEGLITSALGDDVVDGAVACSVSPVWRDAVFQTLAAMFPGALHIVRTASDAGLRVPYTKPELYGIDRAMAVVGAYARFHDSCVVADAGTALTVDAVTANGSVAGGFIMPGAAQQARALSEATSLPRIGIDESDGELGSDTEESIRLGIRYGFQAAAHGLIERAVSAVAAADRILLTGGDAPLIASGLPVPHEIAPNLVLTGLGLVSGRLPAFS